MTLDEFYKQTNKISACFNELGFTDTDKPVVDIEIWASSNCKQYELGFIVDEVTSFEEFANYIYEEVFYDNDDIKKFIVETLKTYDFSFIKDCCDDDCKIYSEDIIHYNDDIVIKLNIFYMLS